MMLQSVMHGKPRERDAKKIMERIKAGSEGDEFKHTDLMGLIEEKSRSRYFSVMNKVKRLVHEETGVTLQTVHGVGYRIPTGREQIRDVGFGYMRRAGRAFGRAVKAIATVGDHRLTDENDRKLRDHACERARYLMQVGRAETKALTLQVGKPQVNPQQEKA